MYYTNHFYKFAPPFRCIVMDDKMIEKQIIGYSTDSLLVGDSISADSIDNIVFSESLIDLKANGFNPEIISSSLNIDLIAYISFTLLIIIALIWHFMPDRFLVIFNLKTSNKTGRHSNSNALVPGSIITGFLSLNFLISAGLFSLLILLNYYPNTVEGMSVFEILLGSYKVLGLYFLYRIIVIYGTSFVFDTGSLRNEQIQISRNILFITGILLIPAIIIITYSNLKFLTFILLIVIGIFQIMRIAKIIQIGKTSTMFSTLHIILYLCTLEIVPVLVLVRLIGNASGV